MPALIVTLQSLLSKNVDGIIFVPVGFANDYFIGNRCEGIDAHCAQATHP
jgi:hypothetical protein